MKAYARLIQLFFVAVIVAAGAANAGAVVTTGERMWVKALKSEPKNFDAGEAIGVGPKDNIYVLGYSSEDFLTVTYAANGKRRWARRFNGKRDADDFPVGLATTQRGVIVAGTRYDALGDPDFQTLRYDHAGNLMWRRIYKRGRSSDDIAAGVAADNHGNAVVTGTAADDYMTVKYGAAGALKWIRRWSSRHNWTDAPVAIVVDRDNNVIVTGRSQDKNGSLDYVTVKYDPAGRLKWARRYPRTGSREDIPAAMAVDRNGNVFVTGSSYQIYSSSYSYFLTVKYGAGGKLKWTRRYKGAAGTAEATAVDVDRYGNAFVTGGADQTGNGLSDSHVIIKYNSLGILKWIRIRTVPGGVQGAGPEAIKWGQKNNIYVYAATFSKAHKTALILYKYGSGGRKKWTRDFDTTGWDDPTAMALDSGDFVNVTGRSTGATKTDYEMLTIRYAP